MESLSSADSALRIRSYNIGFTSRSRKSGRLYQTKFKIDKPKNGSLESWIDPTLRYAFIDFVAFNRLFPKSSETFTMREWRYLTSRD